MSTSTRDEPVESETSPSSDAAVRPPFPFAMAIVFLVALAAVGFCGFRIGVWYESRPKVAGPPPPPQPSSFDPEKFEPQEVVPRFPVVTGMKFVSAKDAQGRIADEEQVLAVEIGGEARAYPINMMTNPNREVFNDRLGGRAIAATW